MREDLSSSETAGLTMEETNGTEEFNPLSPPELDSHQTAPKQLALPVDVLRSRFPCCIVWTPLPPITFFLPMIGHMGICDRAGHIYDFGGFVNKDDFMFGPVARYIQLDPCQCRGKEWDEAVAFGNELYADRCHNICCDNCHSHVAVCLDRMGYRGWRKWNMVVLAFWVFFCGKFTTKGMAAYSVLSLIHISEPTRPY
eukprot:TRINITY_DN3027_c0_g1_i5.p1 TRINITY_DN3027_c0_g1~~TRINITY_DN3027_c0_g1_i5.p1  ORF type:complete len:198 (-),score=39.17 TRINITY_DN3027_c0_g1_i5:69-662(-)